MNNNAIKNRNIHFHLDQRQMQNRISFLKSKIHLLKMKFRKLKKIYRYTREPKIYLKKAMKKNHPYQDKKK